MRHYQMVCRSFDWFDLPMNRKRARRNYASVTSQLDNKGTNPNVPDVYGSKKRARRKVIEQLGEVDEDVGPPLPSDSIAAANLLIERQTAPRGNRTTSKVKNLPRICFVHQIYSILLDNTAVDRELRQAVQEQSWKKFHVIGALEDEFVIMSMTDYVSMIEDAKQDFIGDLKHGITKSADDVSSDLFDRFKKIVQDERFTEMSISRQSLLCDDFDMQEKEILQLIKYGLLLPYFQLDSYWFSVRNLGIFISNHMKGRQELLRMLKRRQTKELLEKQINIRKLRSTVLSHEFLMHDLIGSGRAERIKTTMGDLIRLTKKGELGR